MNNRGFTLIEVVIASVILFSAVAAASAALKSAVHAMAKIQATAYMAQSMKPVCQEVNASLENGRTSGSADLNKTISYTFNAEKIREAENLVSSSSLMHAGPTYGRFMILVYQVDLEMLSKNSGAVSKDQYHYKELVWVKQNFQTLQDLPL